MPTKKTSAVLYPDGAFLREDETDDRLFYSQPRLVVHTDDHAIAAIAGYFRSVLPEAGVILDLMSSWRSHMPEDLPIERLVGLGLNAAEMAENPQLHQALVHDINAHPSLPFADASFDAAVVTVSIQYIVRPVEVFAEVSRILKEGSSFHVVYSNRMFPTKAVAIWKALDDARRADLIASYFMHSEGWEPARTLNIGGQQGHYADPVYVVTARKKSDQDEQIE